MSGLLTEGVASIGAVAAVGVEFAALGALTYGAEKIYKAAEGIVERPDSLDGAAHELTPQEIAYFQSVAKQQVRAAEGVYADNAVGAPRREHRFRHLLKKVLVRGKDQLVNPMLATKLFTTICPMPRKRCLIQIIIKW